MVASNLRVLAGGRKSSHTSSRVTAGSIVRLLVERTNGRTPSLKDVLESSGELRRA